jgi:hypothetical protein
MAPWQTRCRRHSVCKRRNRSVKSFDRIAAENSVGAGEGLQLAAKAFFSKAIKHQGQPSKTITLDGYAAPHTRVAFHPLIIDVRTHRFFRYQ